MHIVFCIHVTFILNSNIYIFFTVLLNDSIIFNYCYNYRLMITMGGNTSLNTTIARMMGLFCSDEIWSYDSKSGQ